MENCLILICLPPTQNNRDPDDILQKKSNFSFSYFLNIYWFLNVHQLVENDKKIVIILVEREHIKSRLSNNLVRRDGFLCLVRDKVSPLRRFGLAIHRFVARFPPRCDLVAFYAPRKTESPRNTAAWLDDRKNVETWTRRNVSRFSRSFYRGVLRFPAVFVRTANDPAVMWFPQYQGTGDISVVRSTAVNGTSACWKSVGRQMLNLGTSVHTIRPRSSC